MECTISINAYACAQFVNRSNLWPHYSYVNIMLIGLFCLDAVDMQYCSITMPIHAACISHLYWCTSSCKHIEAHTKPFTPINMCMPVSSYQHTCTHATLCIRTCVYTHTLMHTHMYMDTRIIDSRWTDCTVRWLQRRSREPGHILRHPYYGGSHSKGAAVPWCYKHAGSRWVCSLVLKRHIRC